MRAVARHRLFPARRNDHRPRQRAAAACSSSSRARSRSATGDELVSLRGPGDCFDSRALVQGGGSNAFFAREETLCNLLPRDVSAEAHQPQSALRRVLLSRHFAQARRRGARRRGGGALQPAAARAGARALLASRRSSSRRARLSNSAARQMSDARRQRAVSSATASGSASSPSPISLDAAILSRLPLESPVGQHRAIQGHRVDGRDFFRPRGHADDQA